MAKRSEASMRQRREYRRSWYANNAGIQRERERNWYSKNASSVCTRKKADMRRLRMEVLLAYGAECACCGEKRYEFLALDHKHGGGREHRETIPAAQLPRWLKNNGYPEGFQVLCHNCNSAKGWHGLCPHDVERFT